MTGLANYRHLVYVLDAEIKRGKRTNREFAMLFFDLDRSPTSARFDRSHTVAHYIKHQ